MMIENNIAKFNGAKVLHKMQKPHSCIKVWFIPNPKDSFIINILYFRTTSGIIKYAGVLIEPDMENRIKHLKHEGYKIIDENK